MDCEIWRILSDVLTFNLKFLPTDVFPHKDTIFDKKSKNKLNCSATAALSSNATDI